MSNPTFTIQFAEDELRKYLGELSSSAPIEGSLESKISEISEAVATRILDDEFEDRVENALSNGWHDVSDFFNMEEYLTSRDIDDAVSNAFYENTDKISEVLNDLLETGDILAKDETIASLKSDIADLTKMVNDMNATLLRIRVAFLGEEAPKEETKELPYPWSAAPLVL